MSKIPVAIGTACVAPIEDWQGMLAAEVWRVVEDPDADDGWRMPDDLFWPVARGLLSAAAASAAVGRQGRAWAARGAELAEAWGRPWRVPDMPPRLGKPFDDWTPSYGAGEEAFLPPGADGGTAHVLVRVVRRLARLDIDARSGLPLLVPSAPQVSVHVLRVLEAGAGRATGDEWVDRQYLPGADPRFIGRPGSRGWAWPWGSRR